MHFRSFLLVAVLGMTSLPTHADSPIPMVQAINTSDNQTAKAWHRLKAHELELTRQAVMATTPEDRALHVPASDDAWLKGSGYDMRVPERQQQGIALLSGFTSLTPALLAQNLHTVETLHRSAPLIVKQQALIDAYGEHQLYFLAGALGPRLGEAFLTAYQAGALSKATALINASMISTAPAKQHFNYPRPFQQPNNRIMPVTDDIVFQDHRTYTVDGAAFPSGHTNTGYTAALLMAEMVPERFVPLVTEGARYGFSRVVLGVHYPLDVIASRMVVGHHVADMLNDPAWRRLFDEAKQQARTALETACGMPLDRCASNPAEDDPFARPDMREFYRYTMTYGLPRVADTAQPLIVPEGAEVLLEAPLPHLTAEQRRALLVDTALGDGYPLANGKAHANFWQRINLVEAVAANRTRDRH